jgi:hypothetical protein
MILYFLILYFIPFLFHAIFSIAEYKNKHRKNHILLFDLSFSLLPVINLILMISVFFVFDLNELLDSFIYEENTH